MCWISWGKLTKSKAKGGLGFRDLQSFNDALLAKDRGKIQNLLPEYEKEILEIRVSKLGASDSYAWLPSKTGVYSAKSGYYESIKEEPEPSQQQPIQEDFNWSADIWKLKTSLKTKYFLWKTMRGALPVGENLRTRQINTEAKCPFCGAEETTHHLFLTCTFATEVWDAAPVKTLFNRTRISSFRELIEKAKLLQSLPPCGIGDGPIHPWIIWSIWLSRNKKIFNDRIISPRETITQAVSLAREWLNAQLSAPPAPIQIGPPLVIADPSTISCHTDAAWSEELKAAGYGWIFSNRRDGLHRAGTDRSSHIRSPLLAEAIAVHHALINASDLGFSNLSIASDSKQLIEAINSETPTKELHGILHDILKISTTFRKISFHFTPRENNRVADSLAKNSLKSFVPDPV
ncbi:Reverse transcriptase zinc-binding domain [Arabidopsis suecica]|uniref:Reverse transcriptase zinc-binding domain n=1 Tax=Arabidopsis suecica TaxID=45249 RepID=A0A8T2CP98_ARASU|nr:Reverse transcriptase zinc-binding domain [Arabidopsis suecica]